MWLQYSSGLLEVHIKDLIGTWSFKKGKTLQWLCFTGTLECKKCGLLN